MLLWVTVIVAFISAPVLIARELRKRRASEANE